MLEVSFKIKITMKKLKSCLTVVVLINMLGYVVLTNLLKGWGITDELGNNYIYTSDYSILYQLDNREYYVIPSRVRSINYNDKWIIAKTIGLNASYRNCSKQSNDGSQYWIINKDASIDSENDSNIMICEDNDYHIINNYPIISNGIIGPMDSISFSNKMNELRIKLDFRK